MIKPKTLSSFKKLDDRLFNAADDLRDALNQLQEDGHEELRSQLNDLWVLLDKATDITNRVHAEMLEKRGDLNLSIDRKNKIITSDYEDYVLQSYSNKMEESEGKYKYHYSNEKSFNHVIKVRDIKKVSKRTQRRKDQKEALAINNMLDHHE